MVWLGLLTTFFNRHGVVLARRPWEGAVCGIAVSL